MLYLQMGPYMERLVTDVTDAKDSPHVVFLAKDEYRDDMALAAKVREAVSYDKFAVIPAYDCTNTIPLDSYSLELYLRLEGNHSFEAHGMFKSNVWSAGRR